MSLKTPIIAIVGRPNVGKSTFFNRALGSRRAVVEDIPGVTRDRNYGRVERYSVPFYLVDTGGFEADATGEIEMRVAEQARVAAEEADVIIALFDGQSGCQEGDREVVQLLREFDKPILFTANKCDGAEQASLTADFYSLGVDEVFDVSALHGRAVKQLVESALERLPNIKSLRASAKAQREKEEMAALEGKKRMAQVDREIAIAVEEADILEVEEANPHMGAKYPAPEEPTFAPVFFPTSDSKEESEYVRENRHVPLAEGNTLRKFEEEAETAPVVTPLPDILRIALIGRPNVGKSTLLNTLTGEQRAITSPIAGTTRDPLHQEITRDGQDFLIIDTAGLRKKARVADQIERYSTIRALNSINECDVAIVLIDAERGPSEQDAKILGLAHEQGRGIILAINKWDAVEKNHKSVKEYQQKIRDTFKFVPYAPMIFISAKTGKRCPKVLETAKEVARARLKHVPTRQLNRLLRNAADRITAPSYRGRAVRLYYAAQVDDAPPRFLLVFNYPRAVHFSFIRALKNVIRDEYGFQGTDIKFVLRKK